MFHIKKCTSQNNILVVIIAVVPLLDLLKCWFQLEKRLRWVYVHTPFYQKKEKTYYIWIQHVQIHDNDDKMATKNIIYFLERIT